MVVEKHTFCKETHWHGSLAPIAVNGSKLHHATNFTEEAVFVMPNRCLPCTLNICRQYSAILPPNTELDVPDRDRRECLRCHLVQKVTAI